VIPLAFAWACGAPAEVQPWAATEGAPAAPTTIAPAHTGTSSRALAEVDVLVVGAGPAGLVAAWQAREAGARVLMIDRDTELGGAARWSGGLMTFSGTPLQAREEVTDGPGQLLAEWSEMTGGDPTDPWVVRYTEHNVPQVYDWLIELGGTFTLLPWSDAGASTPRVHMLDGNGEELVDLLASLHGPDDTWTETELLGMSSAGETPRARVRTAAGEEGWIDARSVVLATGGFLRDLDLVGWAAPDLDVDALWLSTGFQSDGSGHRLLEDLGAGWANPRAIGMYCHGIADPRTAREELMVKPLPDSVWVDTEGRRFYDETAYASFDAGDAVTAQPDQAAFAIYDAVGWSQVSVTDPLLAPDEEWLELRGGDLQDWGLVEQAEDLPALAATLGMDPNVLTSEIDAYNIAVADGGGDAWRDDGELTIPIESPPFSALRLVPVAAKAFGGIAVDDDGRVIDNDGRPLDGLFAAGELTGMAGGSLVSDRGWTGSLSAVILSGRVAGQTAAEFALTR